MITSLQVDLKSQQDKSASLQAQVCDTGLSVLQVQGSKKLDDVEKYTAQCRSSHVRQLATSDAGWLTELGVTPEGTMVTTAKDAVAPVAQGVSRNAATIADNATWTTVTGLGVGFAAIGLIGGVGKWKHDESSYVKLAKAALALAPENKRVAIKQYSGDPDCGFKSKQNITPAQILKGFLVNEATEKEVSTVPLIVENLSKELHRRIKGIFGDEHAHGAARTVVMSLLAKIGELTSSEGLVNSSPVILNADGTASIDTALDILGSAVMAYGNNSLADAFGYLQTRLAVPLVVELEQIVIHP